MRRIDCLQSWPLTRLLKLRQTVSKRHTYTNPHSRPARACRFFWLRGLDRYKVSRVTLGTRMTNPQPASTSRMRTAISPGRRSYISFQIPVLVQSGGNRVWREYNGAGLIFFTLVKTCSFVCHLHIVPWYPSVTPRRIINMESKNPLFWLGLLSILLKKQQLCSFFWTEFFENALRDIFSESILHFFDQKDAPSFKSIGRQIF